MALRNSPQTQHALMEHIRRTKGDALSLFRPTATQERFLRAMQNEDVREAAVTGGNRSGKTLITAVWIAAVALNRSITLRNGEQLVARPARWKHEAELLMWLVGYDWSHIGETLYRLLFRADAFKIIKEGLKFVAYDPENPAHVARKHERKPAPPLIPPSAYCEDDLSWQSKKDRQLHSALLNTGARLVFYPSTGEAAAGNAVHVIWIDEKIQYDEHYPEWQMRLIDKQGLIVWSSWPTKNPSGSFQRLLERATQTANDPVRRAINFQFDGRDNPHVDEETRNYFLSTMDEEEAEARGVGQSSSSRWKLYPNFSPHVHVAYRPRSNVGVTGDDYLAKVLRQSNGIPPKEWTRYWFLDPGHAHCGVLKVAIPPPQFGMLGGVDGEHSAFIVPYAEYDIQRKTADEVGEILAADSQGEVVEDITCDAHAYVYTPLGMAGTTYGVLYEAAFAAHGLRSNRRGTTFSMGGDDTQVRAMLLQGWMSIRSIRIREPEAPEVWVEAPRLRIVTERCPKLCDQLTRCMRASDKDNQPMNKAMKRQVIDLLVCLEYAAIKRNLLYVPVYTAQETQLNLRSVVQDFCKRRGMTPPQQRDDGSVFLGAGRPVF